MLNSNSDILIDHIDIIPPTSSIECEKECSNKQSITETSQQQQLTSPQSTSPNNPISINQNPIITFNKESFLPEQSIHYLSNEPYPLQYSVQTQDKLRESPNGQSKVDETCSLLPFSFSLPLSVHLHVNVEENNVQSIKKPQTNKPLIRLIPIMTGNEVNYVAAGDSGGGSGISSSSGGESGSNSSSGGGSGSGTSSSGSGGGSGDTSSSSGSGDSGSNGSNGGKDSSEGNIRKDCEKGEAIKQGENEEGDKVRTPTNSNNESKILTHDTNTTNQRQLTPLRYSKMTEEEAAHAFENRKKELLDSLIKVNLEKKSANRDVTPDRSRMKKRVHSTCDTKSNNKLFNPDGKINMNNFIIFSNKPNPINHNQTPTISPEMSKRDNFHPLTKPSHIQKASLDSTLSKFNPLSSLNTIDRIPTRPIKEENSPNSQSNTQKKQANHTRTETGDSSSRFSYSPIRNMNLKVNTHDNETRNMCKKLTESKYQGHLGQQTHQAYQGHHSHQLINEKENANEPYQPSQGVKGLRQNHKKACLSYSNADPEARRLGEAYKHDQEKSGMITPQRLQKGKNIREYRPVIDTQMSNAQRSQDHGQWLGNLKRELKQFNENEYTKWGEDYKTIESRSISKSRDVSPGSYEYSRYLNSQKRTPMSLHAKNAKSANFKIDYGSIKESEYDKSDKCQLFLEHNISNLPNTNPFLKTDYSPSIRHQNEQRVFNDLNKTRKDNEPFSILSHTLITPKRDTSTDKTKTNLNEKRRKKEGEHIIPTIRTTLSSITAGVNKTMMNDQNHEIKYDPEGFYKKKIEWLKKKAEVKKIGNNNDYPSLNETEQIQHMTPTTASAFLRLDELTKNDACRGGYADGRKTPGFNMSTTGSVVTSESNKSRNNSLPQFPENISNLNSQTTYSTTNNTQTQIFSTCKAGLVDQTLSSKPNHNNHDQYLKEDNGLHSHILQSYALLENLQAMLTEQKENVKEKHFEPQTGPRDAKGIQGNEKEEEDPRKLGRYANMAASFGSNP